MAPEPSPDQTQAQNTSALPLETESLYEKIQREEKETGASPMETIWERILVHSYTWDRECHGLFDFDVHDIDQQ